MATADSAKESIGRDEDKEVIRGGGMGDRRAPHFTFTLSEMGSHWRVLSKGVI